jgi:hypothetical protein
LIYATIDVAAVVAGVARGEEIFKNSCLGPLPIHWPIPKKERVVDFNPARAGTSFLSPSTYLLFTAYTLYSNFSRCCRAALPGRRRYVHRHYELQWQAIVAIVANQSLSAPSAGRPNFIGIRPGMQPYSWLLRSAVTKSSPYRAFAHLQRSSRISSSLRNMVENTQ